MTNYYEETMPLNTNEEEYKKYYFEESLPIFDKLNTIIKKGQPFQRQALIKNLLIYEKENLFKSLINFIINEISTWDAETVLLLPKALHLLIINTDYVLDNDLFNLIFKHMIISVSTGAEKNKNEYTYYFNKIIEFYSIIDIKNNNQIKKNIFPYTISNEIIQLIENLGIFGQTSSNRKLCCFLSSSLCRIMIKINGEKNNNLNNSNIKKLYERLSYLFWDREIIIDAQIVRELLYIIPLFKDIMFTNEDIIEAIKSYINFETDHIIQVMAIISVLKNIVYLNKEIYIVNILLDKIKEITEDFDYESIYKNIILHTLINEIYNNYLSLNPSFIYQVFKLGIMKNYYNFYKLDIFFIKNFDKYYFLINYFLDNASYLENKYKILNNDKDNNNVCIDTNNNSSFECHEYQELIEQIQSQINFEEYFIKIYNELFLFKENVNNTEFNENIKREKIEDLDNESNNNELLIGNIYNKNKINEDILIFDKYFFEENIDIIINKNNTGEDLNNNFYNKEIIKKILYIYLPKIIACFPNLKSNKTLCDKILSIFDKTNIISVLNIYSSSIKYIESNVNNIETNKKNKKKNILKSHPLYELFLLLFKKNIKLFLQQGKYPSKINNNKELLSYEGNIYNKLVLSILTNTNIIYQESPNLISNDIHILIGKILKLLMPKFYKYYKNITYNTVVNNNTNNNTININNSLNNNKETIKVCYYEKIFDELFNNLISKIIINNNLGNHVIKEYIESVPYFILYSKNRWKYYDLLVKEIFTADNFYKRKYSIIFFEQCFKIFSFGFICKNNLLNDFIFLMKDKVNLISTNAIEIIYKYNKKIISYSIKKFQEICTILNEIYDLNSKAFNDNNNDNNNYQGLIFDKEKNIIINKIISINSNINKYYTEEKLNEEKEKENKLFSLENEILKLSKSINNKNRSKNNINNNNNSNLIINNNINNNTHIEHNKNTTNILQITSSAQNCKNNNNNIFINSSNLVNHKYSVPTITNKNSINIFSLSQKEKNHKITPWIEKSASGVFKDKKGKNSSSKNNVVINNFNKENKHINNDLNNTHYNNRYHSTSKNVNLNKHHLPKIRDLKINRKDLNYINNNIRSIDITFNKLNSKIDDNEEKYYNNINNNNNFLNNINNNFLKKDYNIELLSDKKTIKNDIKLVSFTQNRIPSAKIKIMKSYPIMAAENMSDENPNLYLKNNDNEKKTSSNNQSNLRFNYIFNNISKDNNNINMKCFSNKHINIALRPKSKTMRLKRDSNASNNGIHKIYIDAGK